MNWIKSSILVFVSFFIAMLIAEWLSRIVAPQNMSSSWRVRDDTGLLLNKSFGESIHQHNERTIKYSFKPIGVRVHNFEKNEKDLTTVLVLGDSFTFGWLLDDEYTFVYLLDAHYTNLKLINVATGGWGTADYTKYLENYCAKLNPEKVLVFINSDDIGRMLSSDLYKYDNKTKRIIENIYTSDMKDKIKATLNKLPFYDFLLTNSNLIQLARNAYARGPTNTFNLKDKIKTLLKKLPFYDFSDVDVFKYSTKMFERLVNAVQQCKAEIVAVYTGVEIESLPGVEIENDINPTLRYLDFAEKNNIFELLGLPFFNLSNSMYMKKYRYFKYIDRDVISFDDEHPNEKGAELIYKAVVELKVLN